MAYWLLGLLIGWPVSQSRKGDLLGRVEDRGADISSPVQRGYESSAALPFHVDRTDVIGLLCVRPASSGGVSRLASSVMLHRVLKEENPGLLEELCRPLPNDRRGEEQPGQPPWSEIPVFSNPEDEDFAVRYLRRFIMGSQRHPDAPRLTERQVAAMDAIDEILERPGFSLDMELAAGDLQLINNFRILHSRTAFADGSAGRLLLRLWLAFDGSPQLPGHYQALYGAVERGSYRGGVWPTGMTPELLGRPVADLR
jgi:hypothetical protein